jgi:hypothetical protein
MWSRLADVSECRVVGCGGRRLDVGGRALREAAAGTGKQDVESLGRDLSIIRVDWPPSGEQEAQTDSYNHITNTTHINLTHPYSTHNCHQQYTYLDAQHLTAHIRQDVQKQLRQRFRHIVSPPDSEHPIARPRLTH